MKKFNHIGGHPVLGELPKEYLDGKRYYITPNGRWLPSVTTFLSSFENDGLKRWEQRVGVEEANRVRYKASTRGKEIHSIMESYLRNEDPKKFLDEALPDQIQSFQDLCRVVDTSIDNVYYVEAMLYSEMIGLAGQTDLIAEWDGILSIIDWKTAKKPKKIEYIQNYLLQATAYSLLLEDMTGLKAKQIVIIISVDHQEPQVFVDEREKYIGILFDKIKAYRGL